MGRIPEDGDPGRGNNLFEKIKPLRAQIHGNVSEPREVRPRPGEAGDESSPNRIADGHHDDGDRCRCLLGRTGCRRSPRHNDVNLETDQIHREVRELFGPSLGPSVLNRDVLALHVAQLA
jgi:hypothetical protein